VIATYGIVTFGAGSFVKLIVGKIIEQLPGSSVLDKNAIAKSLIEDPKFIEGVRPALKWLGGDTLVRLVEQGQLPWIVLGVLVLSTITLPGLVLISAYDRISEDLTSGYSRYVLQRVHRGTYLAGKVLGSWAALMLAIIATHLVLLLFVSDVPGVGVSDVVASFPRIWLGMALLLLGYVSFTQMLSVYLKPPFLVLALGALSLFGLWFLSLFPPLHDLWLGTWDIRLFVLDPEAVLVYVGYSAAFLGLGFAGLRWRDV
jgi:hypothetical protein